MCKNFELYFIQLFTLAKLMNDKRKSSMSIPSFRRIKKSFQPENQTENDKNNGKKGFNVPNGAAAISFFTGLLETINRCSG